MLSTNILNRFGWLFYVLSAIIAIVAGHFIATHSLLLSGAGIILLSGLSIFFLLIKKKSVLVIIIFALAPFTGLIKVFLNFKEAPLFLDLPLIMLLLFSFFQDMLTEKENRVKFPLVSFLIIGYLGVSLLEIFNPNLPDLIRGVYGFRASGAFYMAAFFVPFYAIKNRKDLRGLVWMFIITGIIVAIYGINQYLHPSATELAYARRGNIIDFVGYKGWHYLAKPFSTMISSSHYGMFMVLTALLSLTILNKNILTFGKKLLKISFILSVAALLLSLSRGSYVALIVGVITLVFLGAKGKNKIGKKLVAMAAICLMIVITIIGFIRFMPNTEILRIRLSMSTNMKDTALQGRLKSWPIRLQTVKDNPLGLGIGINSGENLFEASDNEFLATGIENGWFGLLLFILIIGSVLRKGVQEIRKEHEDEFKAMAFWITSFSLAIVSVMITNHILQAFPINMYFWFLAGLLYRLQTIADKELYEDTQ